MTLNKLNELTMSLIYQGLTNEPKVEAIKSRFDWGKTKQYNPSIDGKPPRVVSAPVKMECKVTQIIPAERTTNFMVHVRVLLFHA